MSQTTPPRPLAENAGLAFPGAHLPAGLIVGGEKARRMLALRNRHGKANADVLRLYVDATDPGGAGAGRWVVDFPADTTHVEASLYEAPFAVLKRAHGVLHRRADPMRIAIARIDSFLAAPLGSAPRGFARIDSATLPGAGLVVVATDDDFLATVLRSGVFETWVAANGGRLRVRHVASFPFPWPPRTGRSELTRVQLELRDSVVRASPADLDTAVAATYGWRDIEDEDDLVSRLGAVYNSRSKES
ncbi:MAG TPA: hypothetical protein VMM36_10220 [Opitutaceae bacterium]|nr:hypothetical protein [Opitutaceae bacterium]